MLQNENVFFDGGKYHWSLVEDELHGRRVFVRGYAFCDGRWLQAEALAGFLSQAFASIDTDNFETLVTSVLKKINGFFAGVYQRDGICLVIADRVRSIPLFYRETNGHVLVSDEPRRLVKDRNVFRFNVEASMDFLMSGYVTGNETLHADVFQVPAGKFVAAVKDGSDFVVKSVSYFRYFSEELVEEDDDALEDRLYEKLCGVFERYFSLLKDRRLLMPLSGGLDSRLVIAMLKKMGIADMVCFSYGRENDPDSGISRDIARSLGYQWRFVSYDGHGYWNRLRQDALFEKYLHYGSAFSSIAHIQDWPAIRTLLADFEADDPVLVPGHTGDFISGGHIPHELVFRGGRTDFGDLTAEAVFSHHYDLWPLSRQNRHIRQMLQQRIKRQFAVTPADVESAMKCYELWEWTGRQSRFIINSLRIYEFFRLSWAMPLWDDEIMRFFRTLKLREKYKKRLYINTLYKKVFVGKLKVLSDIPVNSTTDLVYRKKGDPFIPVSNAKKAINFILGIPVVNWAPVLAKNYHNDPFFVYGYFMADDRPASLFKPTRTLLHDIGSKIPPEVYRIVEPGMNRPILMQTLRGLFSARYLNSL